MDESNAFGEVSIDVIKEELIIDNSEEDENVVQPEVFEVKYEAASGIKNETEEYHCVKQEEEEEEKEEDRSSLGGGSCDVADVGRAETKPHENRSRRTRTDKPFTCNMKKHDKKKKKFFKYSEENMQNAIAAVREGAKVRTAARLHGVPHPTLFNKIKGRAPLERKMGPATLIPAVEEEALVKFLLASAKKGFPITKSRLKLLAGEITGKKVGEKWLSLFLRRHKNIFQRQAEAIHQGNAEESIRHWHENLKNYLDNYGHSDLLQVPGRIINADESGFMMNPKTGLVLGPKTEKNVYEVKNGAKEEQITTLITISADGFLFPPTTVLPFERVPLKVAESYNEQWALGTSKSGWMTSEVFLGYIKNSLLPALKERKVAFPVLFLIDGHKSHLAQEVAQFCEDNEIIIYSFWHTATHRILQPADVSVFRSLKQKWASEVEDFRSQNRYQPITKSLFGPLLEKALEKVTPQTISNGFRICGLYPFDANNIDYSKCLEHKSWMEDHGEVLKPAQLGFAQLLTIESLMRSGRAEEFRKTYRLKTNWEGDESALELYKVWFKIRNSLEGDDKLEPSWQAEVQPPNESASEELQPPNLSASEEGLKKLEERKRKTEEKQTAKVVKKRKIDEELEETSDEDEDNISKEVSHLQDSSGGEWQESESEDEEELEKAFWEDENFEIDIGDWILVQYLGKKSASLFYVGKVLNKSGDKFNVTFCKNRRGTTFIFPSVIDEAEVERSKIKKKLPCPTERRGHFTFSVKFPANIRIV